MLVSELMLQQTPVARVLPVYDAWLERWPTPGDLAAAPVGDAIRAWGRLGYPRRAIRLHAAAVAITEQHGGEVPARYDALRALPGVGDYTASAVLAFAFGRRQAVLDTNVRRVLARVVTGVEFPPTGGDRWPSGPWRSTSCPTTSPLRPPGRWRSWSSAPWSAPRPPLRCESCPIATSCAWRSAGHPAYDGPPRRGQAWAGTDRQCRGRLMALARDAESAVSARGMERAWPDDDQRTRCLGSLLDDGLLVAVPGGYALPA